MRVSDSLVIKALKAENTITKNECRNNVLNNVQKKAKNSFAKIILTHITL